MRIGRGRGNEVTLRGARVHPLHAVLVHRDGAVELFDLSGEGVLVEGRRVGRALLRAGDFLRIGDELLRLESGLGVRAHTPDADTTQSLDPEPRPPLHPAQIRVQIRGCWRSHGIPCDRPSFLGKSPDNDVIVEEPTVSRWHCRLVPGEGSYEIEDLCSTNGTFVNGDRVERAPLRLGAEIRLGRARLQFLATAHPEPAHRGTTFVGLVGGSAAMARVFAAIARYAALRDPVLLYGETGTGKELVARALHSRSTRPEAPYVALNCGAIPRDLVESELFGHERGAFSGAVGSRAGLFEEANGGTLFLDEVAELTADAQAKLLRALESGEVRRVGANQMRTVDVRVVAACNRPLADLVRAGRFRRDLFHRLCVVEISLPPLRDRLDDLERLCLHFLGAAGKGLRPEAVDRLRAHRWPGNVRELRNVLRRATLCAEGAVIGPEHLVFDADASPADGEGPGPLAEIERRAILHALHRHDGNKTAACRELGISRSTFFEKLRRYGLLGPTPQERESAA
jgi:DNA-binding NtrC family response regulator